MLLILAISLIFFSISKDKANTFRIAICALSFLPIIHLYASPIFLLLSLVANDEAIRRTWRWRLIVFSGIDGSGKSSHAKETALWLNQLGIPTVYYHFFKHPLVTALSLVKRKVMHVKESEVKTYSPEFHIHIKRHFLPKLRPLIQYIDNWIYIGFRLMWHMLKGEWIIADRYFYDYFIRFKCLGYFIPPILRKLYLYVIPHPHLLIIFDVSPEVSFRRRGGEHPLWYYRKARKEFLRLAKITNSPIINTERDFSEVQDDINKLILEKLIMRR